MFKTGASYIYDNVPMSTVEDLQKADSVGSFLNQFIKPKYKAKAVGPKTESKTEEARVETLENKVKILEARILKMEEGFAMLQNFLDPK